MTSFSPEMMNLTSTVTVWEGASSDLANIASKGHLRSSSYRLTEDAIHFASGIVSSHEETLPLWAVRDVDLVQSMAQRARNIGDLALKIDPSAGVYGQNLLVLRAIKDPKMVRDLVLKTANQIRAYWNQRGHDRDIERQRAAAASFYTQAPTAAPVAAPTGDAFMEKLSQLAAMRQNGLLDDHEFAAAKAKLLS